MIKAVIFDFDGTLIDTNGLILESFKHTFSKHLAICPKEEEIVKHFGEPLIKTMKFYDNKNAEELYKTYITYNERIHDKMVKSFDGALEIIMKLKKMGIKSGIVSSKRKDLVKRGLRVIGLPELMDVIITPEDTSKHKPDGEPLEKACSILNIKPKEALMVGDSHFDILCGKNAGAKTCLVKYSILPIKELMKYAPDYVIDNLIEIEGIIEEENSTCSKAMPL